MTGDPVDLSREFRSLVRSIRAPLEDEMAERATLPPARRERLKTMHRDTMRLFQLVNLLFEAQGEAARHAGSDLVDLSAKTMVIPKLRDASTPGGRSPQGTQPLAPQRGPNAADAAPKILVVDDNEVSRTVARATLEGQGYTVIQASCGAEALAAFDREAPDCILLDVQMPDIDGVTVCEQIRTRPGGGDTPVVFLTAQRDLDTFDRALRVGGNDFLAKPVRPAELVVRVESGLKLRQMREDLREHYETLKKQRDDLMRLQLQKERLTAFVIHDLKNPVTTIDLVAQLLLGQRELSPDAQDLVSDIRSQVTQMSRMIMNLLDLAKADEGQLLPKRAELDARALIDDTLTELTVQATARNVRLESRIDVDRLRGDRDLLHRMLANLIENAIRHAPANTAITVTAAPLGAATEIRVIDRGGGVPEAMRERIFSPFVQLEDGTGASQRAGRGLGLAFCHVVATCHGGSIHVADAAPGAAFCVVLPDAP